MKKIAIIAIGLLLIIIQLSITNKLNIFGARPDFLLVYVVIMGMYLDNKTNYISAVVLAIVFDSLISAKFGISLLILVTTTYVVKLFVDLLHEEKIWSRALMFFTGTLISTLLYFALNQIFFVPVGYGVFFDVLLAKSVLNIGAGLILTPALRPVFNHIMKNWW